LAPEQSSCASTANHGLLVADISWRSAILTGKVEGHVQNRWSNSADDAGIYIIAPGNALTPEHHRQMAEKGIFRAVLTPFTKYRVRSRL